MENQLPYIMFFVYWLAVSVGGGVTLMGPHSTRWLRPCRNRCPQHSAPGQTCKRQTAHARPLTPSRPPSETLASTIDASNYITPATVVQHDVVARFAAVAEADYLALEIVGETPRAVRACHADSFPSGELASLMKLSSIV